LTTVPLPPTRRHRRTRIRCESVDGAVDPSRTSGERATGARLSDFVAELRARVAPVSAAMMLGALVRMLSALEPERDWGPLARVYNHPRQTAAPSRDKLSRPSAPRTCSSWGCG
jgi:hypothetical protein